MTTTPKAMRLHQREIWAFVAPTAAYTTPVSAHLVKFAGIRPCETVLNLGTGSSVSPSPPRTAGWPILFFHILRTVQMKSLLVAICTVIALSSPAFAQDDSGGDDASGDSTSDQTTTDNPPDATSPAQDTEPEGPVSEDVLKQYEAACKADDGSLECAEIAEQVCESNTADLTACRRAAAIPKGNPRDVIMVRPRPII